MNKEKQKIIPEMRFPEFEGEWNEKILEKLCLRISDGIHSTPKYDDSGEYYFVNGNNLVNGVIVINKSTKKVAKKEFEKHKRELGSNTLLLSINGTIGNLSEYNNEKVVLGKSACYINIDINKVDKKFIQFSLKTENIRSYFNSELTGSTIKNLSLKTIKNTSIKLPSPKEQQKIANCLSSLENIITAETDKLENLKDHKKGLLQQLFPSNGETKPQFRFPEFVNDGDWEEKVLGEISEITTGTSNRQDSTKEEGKYTFFDRSQDIRTSNRFLFDGEAIIVAGEGQEFKPKYFIGKFDLHQRAYAILNFDDKTIGKFLYYSIYKNRSYFLRYAVGSTVKSLRLPIFQNMPTLISSNPKEQQKIADCLSSTDDLIEAQKIKIKALKNHKKGLMQQLFPSTL